jgi:DNA-binding winged helix-turn-helix (wHTH) protein/dipeptidyl aminopeptidase/acylaminoacyl peptidase
MGLEINALYRFEGFELDPANRVFALDGKPIAIPSRAFDLLLYMVSNTERLLTKEELMKAVWGDTIVEESNLTQSVFLLRKALAAHPSTENKLIVTVPGRGYRFASQVERVAIPPTRSDALDIPVNGATHSSEGAPAQLQSVPNRTPPDRWRWYSLGALVAAAAIAAVILFPGSPRVQGNKLIPLPYRVTANAPENPVITYGISPNGKYLAFTDPQLLTIQTLPSGETRSIPLGSGVAPGRVIWYPDATRLLVGESVKGSYSIFVYSILSGKLSLLRENAVNPVVSPDGARIVYADGNFRELWLMDENGENPRRLLAATAPDKLYAMSWSPDGRRVWFAREHWDKEQETITLETCDLKGASRTIVMSDPSARAFRLLGQGRLIFAAAEVPQNFTNLWEQPVNAALGTPSGPPRKLTDWTNLTIYGISATADGKQVALLSGAWQADVYVGDLRAGGTELANTRRLTLDESDDLPAFWTPDSQAVVFFSNRNGKFQVFRQRLDQSVPELLSLLSEEAFYPRFGGPWIYFRSVPAARRGLSWTEPLTLRRIPMNGGASNDVIRDAGIDVGCASGRPDICVLARLKSKVLTFYRFDHATGQGGEIGHMEFDSTSSPSFDLSPDGSEIAALDPKGAGNRIRRIPLSGGNYSEVEVPGRKNLEVLFWAADGKGWFVSSVTPTSGEYLLHVNSSGESQVLFEQPQDGRDTWGVPSHDGKHLALLRWTNASNVWMIDNF